MKEMLAANKKKLIGGLIAILIAAAMSYFGLSLSDVTPSEKTQEIVGKAVKPGELVAPGAPIATPAKEEK